MRIRNSACIALAIVATAAAAHSAEATWPKDSASDFAVHVALARFRIHADHCSASVPALQPEFEGLIERLGARIQGFSKDLRDSEVFRGMRDEPVPAEIIEAFTDSFHDLQHNIERRDAAAICPKALQDFGDMDDESLKSGLTQAFTAVQNMIRNLEQATVHQGTCGEDHASCRPSR